MNEVRFGGKVTVRKARGHAPYADGSEDVWVHDENLGIVELMRRFPDGHLVLLEKGWD